ncbi:MAG: hypothetical protein K2N35_09990 [Muribaculaceae bacterium]|nr:hypothetical protein [Muribaculaceae bacterium]
MKLRFYMHSVGLALLVSIDGQFPEPYTVERATTKVPRFFDFFKKYFKRPRFVSLSIYLCTQKRFCYGED